MKEYMMVGPTNLNPLFARSLLKATEVSEFVGIWAIAVQSLVTGTSPTKRQK